MTNTLNETLQGFITKSMKEGDDLFVVRVGALEEMQHLAREKLSTAETEKAQVYVKGYIAALSHILQAVYNMRNKALQEKHASYSMVGSPGPE